MSTVDDGKKVVQGFFEAVSEGRLEDLPQYLAADVVDHNKIIHGEADEPGAAFDGLRQQAEALAPLTVQVDELIGEGDRVVARVTQRGVHSAAHPRMPEPTGRSFEIEAVWIFTLRDGRIAEIRAVSDRLGLFAQLGWPLPTAG
ncbi:ester cyclase [Streptomyces sp. NBC_00557]|uniref:ester cyclase n=1 Tax=Streptomyces sp. NBC_00557 TaxID=2975776 RepID=UPI002E80A939|nr:ester cyclase [Streptomyces sp. NBC_00557]WUC35676.1 ester cyclase [Streptomyces sp. NBC_00557]